MPQLDHHALNHAETELQRAVLAGDVAALSALLHDDVRFTGPDGRLVTKEQDLETHRSGVLKVTTFAPRAQDVLVAGDAGITLVEADVAGTVRDEPFTARLRYTRTWIRADGAWRVIAAQATAVSDSSPGRRVQSSE